MPRTQLSLSQLTEKRRQSKKVRRVFERDWSLNLAYLAGYQNVSWDATTGRIFELVVPKDELRTVHNEMQKVHRTEKAKLIKTKPIPSVLPVSENNADLLTARVASAYLKQLMDEWNFERRLRGAVAWAISTGNVFLKWYWADGHNKLAIVPPFDVYPDPYARKFYDARWVIHSQFMDIEAAKDLYGQYKDARIDYIRNSKTEPLSDLEINTFSPMGYGAENLEGTIISEYFSPPSRSNPEGDYAVFTESGIVFQMAYPFAHKKLPFTHIGHLERPNALWYYSIFDPLRKLQDEINRAESQIIMNRNLSNGKWYLPPGLELENMPNAEPGQILIPQAGSAGQEPIMIQVDSMPQWVAGEVDRYKTAMQDIAGQHEVSNGGVPGRVEAAQAIQLLQEQDDSVLRETIDSIEEAIEDGFMISLQLFKQYGTSMDIKIYDKNGNFEKRFLKKDLLDPSMRVKVQTTTGLPQTIAGKWDRVLNLWMNGLIQDPNQALEMLDIGGDNPDLIPQIQDKKKAWEENLRMSSGEVIKSKKWEDHAVHMDEHKKFMKSPEFDALDAETQAKFEYHLDTHDKWDNVVLQENATKAQYLPQAAGAGPTKPPQPPQANGSPAPVQ